MQNKNEKTAACSFTIFFCKYIYLAMIKKVVILQVQKMSLMLENCVEKIVINHWLLVCFYKKLFIIILQQFTTFKIIWSLIRFAQVKNSNTLYNTILFDGFLKALLQHILSHTESDTPQQHSALKYTSYLVSSSKTSNQKELLKPMKEKRNIRYISLNRNSFFYY